MFAATDQILSQKSPRRSRILFNRLNQSNFPSIAVNAWLKRQSCFNQWLKLFIRMPDHLGGKRLNLKPTLYMHLPCCFSRYTVEIEER